MQCRTAIRRLGHGQLHLRSGLPDDLARARIVLDEQHRTVAPQQAVQERRQVRAIYRALSTSPAMRGTSLGSVEAGTRARSGRVIVKVEPFARSARDLDVSAEKLAEVPGNGQAETGSIS